WWRTFRRASSRLSAALAPFGVVLMPTGMHPWMDPAREFVRWAHGDAEIYEAFDRIFDCSGHGWSNLQSTHLNLPFADDEQFGRLHAAIRLVVPLIPGLAASSPISEGRVRAYRDTRLHVYRTNAASVPAVAGMVVPEHAKDRATYDERILSPLYHAIAPHDPQGILQYEWLNARGAIARFDRNAIEIRLIDSQECPRMDLAVAGGISAVVRMLANDPIASVPDAGPSTRRLSQILRRAVTSAEETAIDDSAYLAHLGLKGSNTRPLAAVWRELLAKAGALDSDAPWARELTLILEQGSLATRILEALPKRRTKAEMVDVYRELVKGLAAGSPFEP
ncbi:MAG: glutamate--cysteine ligase, partial [Myxococcales bacterium]|nr:glutamate--cysteine ligase [Myxococcales bacterium]